MILARIFEIAFLFIVYGLYEQKKAASQGSGFFYDFNEKSDQAVVYPTEPDLAIFSLTTACAAARRAIGTLNGEQLT